MNGTSGIDELPPRAEKDLLLKEATRLNEELSALVAITDSGMSTLDLEDLMKAVLSRLVQVMKADAGAIMLEEAGGLSVRATIGFDAEAVTRPPIPFGEGFAGRIFVSGEPLYIEDVRTDPRILGPFLMDQGIVSMLGVPLRTRELLVGVLHVDWRRPHAESAIDHHLLEIAAERCASAIVKARLFSDLRANHAAAERARERLTLALSAADLGVWDWNVLSGAIAWDATNERIFGFPAGGYDGSLETFVRTIHPDDLESVKKALDAALQGAIYAPSFRIVRPDGALRWLSVRGHLQRAPDGKPLRLLGVTADVTDEKERAEEKRLTDERLRSTNEQLRALSAHIQTVREEEAVRIAREIHDELGQLLTALRMDVSWIRNRLAKIDSNEMAPLLTRADDMAELTERTIRTVQRISEELRPSALDQLGLEAAIEALLAGLAQRSGIGTSLAGTIGDRRLGNPIETGVFRIVQELLTNVARHSGARSVRVELRLAGERVPMLSVRVVDDGRGILENELADPRSLGLAGIRERVLMLGGSAEFHGRPGAGTEVLVAVPCGELAA